MSKKTKIEIVKSVWGKFKMPYEVGHTPEVDEKVAAEMIETGYAKEFSAKAKPEAKPEAKPKAKPEAKE